MRLAMRGVVLGAGALTLLAGSWVAHASSAPEPGARPTAPIPVRSVAQPPPAAARDAGATSRGGGIDASACDEAADTADCLLRSCDSGNATGCARLGLVYRNGWGVPKDDAQAAVYYRKGCDGGDHHACFNLGVAYEDGRGVAKDGAQANVYYRRACTAETPRGASTWA